MYLRQSAIVLTLLVFISLFTFYLRGKVQIMSVWLHLIFTNCTTPCNQPRSDHRTFRAIPLVSPSGGPHPSKENYHLTSNPRDSKLKFLTNCVSRICKSGDLHLCLPLRKPNPATWPCLPSRWWPPAPGALNLGMVTCQGLPGSPHFVLCLDSWHKAL